MAGTLSSVNLIAAAGILGNIGGVAIAANTDVVSKIATYDSLSVVDQFQNVKTSANSSALASSTKTSLYNLAGNIFPALTDAIPTAYTSNLGSTPLTGFSGIMSTGITNIMGSGDVGKFEQVFGISNGFAQSTNQMIISAKNANNASALATYISQDNTITGGLSQVTQAFNVFAQDLAALGNAINLQALQNLGSPQGLLQQIYLQTNGSVELNTALLNAGISQSTLNDIATVSMTDEQQKIVFNVMTKITDSALVQILMLLKVRTRGLSNLAELLNPVRTFPKSFNTLTAPTSNGIRAIYINESGAINTNLETELPANVLGPVNGYVSAKNTYAQLKNIIPPDWALANKALQAGLQQVKSIFSSTVPLLSASSAVLESNKGLNLINALTSPLPAAVSNYFATTLSTGTGPDGTILIADVIGSAGGWVLSGNIANVNSVLATMTEANDFDSLTNGTDGVYSVMANVISGAYGDLANSITITNGLPGAGTYTDGNVAFTGPGTPGVGPYAGQGLLPAAYSIIGTIIAGNGDYANVVNSAWANVAAQIALQTTLQTAAGINYANLLPGSKPMALAMNVGQYGNETDAGGAAWLMESVAVGTTLGGQAILSSLRETRNQTRLQQAGIQTDIIVSDAAVGPQIPLTPGQYTAAEAATNKII